MEIQYATRELAPSYSQAVDTVARERKYLGSTSGFPVESTVDFVNFIIDKNLAQYYAVENKEVVGWCDIIPKSYEGLSHVGVLGMGIIEAYRAKGLGSQLIEKTLKHAKGKGLEKVELEVYESNKAAIALYEKFGFIREGNRINGRKLDGRYDNIIMMGKFLLPSV